MIRFLHTAALAFGLVVGGGVVYGLYKNEVAWLVAIFFLAG